jgi:hypothetical protein
MIISMQGNWTVKVKSKSAAYDQRFIVSGANSGNGTHAGVVGTSVNVTGDQWTIAIQNNPGSGYQLSDTKIKFPHLVGGNNEFDIWSNDAGSDEDFNDLILTCSTSANINDFIIYGNVSLYSGRCIFNPCRKDLFAIESKYALKEALKNVKLRKILEKDYPERIPEDIIGPIPPDPEPFKPIVIDLYNEATQHKTGLVYKRLDNADTKSKARLKKDELVSEYATKNFTILNSIQKETSREFIKSSETIELTKVIDGLLLKGCTVAPATNTTLTFEEYDRTAAELAGGSYSGTGNRRLLGDTITDMYGNYIFRFSFDMTFPYIEDSTDIAPDENTNVVAYPDVIVKVTGFSPYTVLYESAPHYNIPNLKRINLCLPKSVIQPSSSCYNGNLIGSLGNVFLGGNQNSSASFSDVALRRYGNSNYLESTGMISVGSSLAGFNIECASWYGWIDIKGCMHDLAKTAAQNKAKWYTIRIKRAGTSKWHFVSQNYKHPKFSKRNVANYIGDDVGPFFKTLFVDGVSTDDVPAYTNIQSEIFVDGIDWEFSNFDRYMQLNTRLYDLISGERTPGKFYVRVDCYDKTGNHVPGATDMIALYIHNNPLNFALTAPMFTDASVVNSGCGLYRLTDAQMNTPIQLSFKANDPDGFVHSFALTMGRCPTPMIALQVNQPNPPLSDTLSGQITLSQGNALANVHNTCIGYTGTIQEFSDAGMINIEIQPALLEGGWIKAGEYFTSLSFYLLAYKRMTNGYNTGLSDDYWKHTHIYMERINP